MIFFQEPFPADRMMARAWLGLFLKESAFNTFRFGFVFLN